MTAAEIAEILEAFQYTFADERELQESVKNVLRLRGLVVEREVRLGATERIDLLVDGDIGVEVKIACSSEVVARQLQRYARNDWIRELVLVTHKASHHRFLPSEIGGKPLAVAWIGGAL